MKGDFMCDMKRQQIDDTKDTMLFFINASDDADHCINEYIDKACIYANLIGNIDQRASGELTVNIGRVVRMINAARRIGIATDNHAYSFDLCEFLKGIECEPLFEFEGSFGKKDAMYALCPADMHKMILAVCELMLPDELKVGKTRLPLLDHLASELDALNERLLFEDNLIL